MIKLKYVFIFFSVVMAVLIAFWGLMLFASNKLISGSNGMYPTIMKNAKLYYKPLSDKNVINRWDIVIYQDPIEGKTLCHRVVGLPNETISVETYGIVIDGVRIKSPAGLSYFRYITPVNDTVSYPYYIPNNSFFLLGDNPNRVIYDSRCFGFVNRKHVLGVVSSWVNPPVEQQNSNDRIENLNEADINRMKSAKWIDPTPVISKTYPVETTGSDSSK